MSDVFTKEKRSELMSRIRSTRTKIELKMKAALEANKIEFQYQPKLFGKPDFLVPPNIVIFCDSSFWHGRNWSALKKKLPEKYWLEHIKNNKRRDRIVNKTLKSSGYIILRFWDTKINREIEECLRKLRQAMLAGQGEISNECRG